MYLQRDKKDFSTFLFNIHKSNALFIYTRKKRTAPSGQQNRRSAPGENASFPVRAACLLCRGFLKVTGFAKGLCLRVRSRCFVSHPVMAFPFCRDTHACPMPIVSAIQGALFLPWRRISLGTVRQNQGPFCANCENLRKCIDKGQRGLYI